MWLTRFAISRPLITTLLFAALAIFGLVAFSKIARSSYPPGVESPVVLVYAAYPGAAPQEIERLIIKPIDDQLSGIDNVDQVSATAQEGAAAIMVRFKMGSNLDLAAINVQSAVDTARVYLPADLDPPAVVKNGSAQPLMQLAVSSHSMSAGALTNLVDSRLEPMIKAIPGIQQVDVSGQTTREFEVEPLPERLDGLGATLDDVFNTIASNNANLPGGILRQSTLQASMSIHAEVNNARDLLGIPLPIPGSEYKNVDISDVAYAFDGHAQETTISHLDGRPLLMLDISGNINSDEIRSTAMLRQRLKEIESQFPALSFREIYAPADYTQRSLNGVWQSLAEGIILTMIVVLLFLHAWRNAIVVMVAIPTSILSTFVVMALLGFHFDMMSLMGLSLIIGILVDDSIVVLENIARHRDGGEDAVQAATKGRDEIATAALTITMVDVVVFLPIAFLSGVVGAFLREFGIVIVIATLFSLLVSFTLTPLLAARWSLSRRHAAGSLSTSRKFLLIIIGAGITGALVPWPLPELRVVLPVMALAALLLTLFLRRYDGVLAWYKNRAVPYSLDHGSFVSYACGLLLLNALALLSPAPSACIVINVFILVCALIAHVAGWVTRRLLLRGSSRRPRPLVRFCADIGTERRLTIATFLLPVAMMVVVPLIGHVSYDFVPQIQTGQISMTVTYPPGTPMMVTERYVSRLENAILKIRGVSAVTSTVGLKPEGWSSAVGSNYAQLTAQTTPSHRHDAYRISALIRRLADLVPGARLTVEGESSGSSTPIFYSLSGPEDEIGSAADKVARALRSIPGSVNVMTSNQDAAPRLNVVVDRARARVLGVSPAAAARIARLAIDGAVATKVRTSTGLIDVRVQLPPRDQTLAQLAALRVRANDGTLVPLADIATLQWTKAPLEIKLLNNERVVDVYGGLLPGYSLGSVTGPLQAEINRPGFLPPGVHLTAQGDTEYLNQTLQNMGIALLLSFMLVYILMAVLYGSLLEPLIVMSSVPLAIIGALLALAIMHRIEPVSGQSLNLLSLIGIVMLFGLVAKNGILLVDFANKLRTRGMTARQAITEAAATRLRPILMTTFAMIFGMLPLALGFAAGGEWRQAMGTVIIGGLASSLILTLFLVPTIYNAWLGALERRKNERALMHIAYTATPLTLDRV